MENIEIVKQIKDVFDPIAKKLGMSELKTLQHTNTELSFGYLATDIGLEISIDLNYFFIFALIFKANSGEIPVGYEDKIGNLQKIYIQNALKKIGIDNSNETKELQKLGGNYLNCSAMVKILSKLFENNWSAIKSKADIIFSKK